MSNKEAVEKLLSLAGITIDGGDPWDIKVHNDDLYRHVLARGSLGLGESYMAGWWDCEKLDECFFRILRADLGSHIKKNPALLLSALGARLFNLQSKRRAFQIGERHYDIGNDLFVKMLDKRLNYSCGYWQNAGSVDEAQEHKLELICQVL